MYSTASSFAVVDADLRHVVVVGDPDQTAGHRRRAAKEARLFQQDDALPLHCRGQRRSQACRPGPDYDDVRFHCVRLRTCRLTLLRSCSAQQATENRSCWVHSRRPERSGRLWATMRPMRGGNIVQAGFVVSEDQYDATDRLLDELRASGPSSRCPTSSLPEQQFRGEPTSVDMSVAIAYSGATTQVEIIVQHNDAPSLYVEFVKQHGGRFAPPGLPQRAPFRRARWQPPPSAVSPLSSCGKTPLDRASPTTRPCRALAAASSSSRRTRSSTRVFGMIEKAAQGLGRQRGAAQAWLRGVGG